ncbi:DUF6265 family protein [Flavimarina sp. Hel_I_48]|uniref:DUF6265 family protein n=1 Tax=Flavimarina sp. Hel_I_48 TaxID=1392488 RepID=UPI0004DF34C7|nr:DUF6265 family protein [Flavimarina sp. Hel_I_48]
MKIVLLSFFLVAISCQSDKNSTPFFDKFPGKWIRTNEEAGKSTYEHWEKAADQEFTGMAFTLEKNDTIFKEDLRIYKEENTWNLEVTAPKEQPAIFKVTEQNADGFTAESPQNKYPKKVEYSLKNGQLTAKISGGGPEIVFDFEKIKD